MKRDPHEGSGAPGHGRARRAAALDGRGPAPAAPPPDAASGVPRALAAALLSGIVLSGAAAAGAGSSGGPGGTGGHASVDTAAVQARYLRERAACELLPAGDERGTCLREAAAARAEALRGGLDAAAGADLDANALARCEALRGDERRDCIARMRGAGSVSGSVEGGGLLREYGTREIGPAPAR